MADFWSGKKVLVTGGAGFLGRYVVTRLEEKGATVSVPRIEDYDLRRFEDCLKACDGQDLVIHLAGVVGGIDFNRTNPATVYTDNVLLNTHMMEAARVKGVKKFVGISSACGYPLTAPVPLKEESFFDGPPEPTNGSYGFAKRMLAVQAEAYRQQYGLNAITLILFNLYGPCDNFDPAHSHVIPALIRKHLEGNEVACWGDGSPSRSFLYVEDAADGILLAAEKYDQAAPLNIGTPEEVTIKDLVRMIAKATAFSGAHTWDTSKPNGQPRRCADISKAKALLGFEAATPLREGLKKTVDWYNDTRRHPGASQLQRT